MAYVHRTFFAQSGGLENTGLRETKLDPTAIPAVRSFSRRSPQILAILSAQLSERELCRGVKWRRKRAWQTTLFPRKQLISLGTKFDEVRIPRVGPRYLSEMLFLLIPWITRPSFGRLFRRSSSTNPHGCLRHLDLLCRQRAGAEAARALTFKPAHSLGADQFTRCHVEV